MKGSFSEVSSVNIPGGFLKVEASVSSSVYKLDVKVIQFYSRNSSCVVSSGLSITPYPSLCLSQHKNSGWVAISNFALTPRMVIQIVFDHKIVLVYICYLDIGTPPAIFML